MTSKYDTCITTYAEPTLKQLVLLRVTQWYEVGLHLDLDETDLATIECNNPKDLKACVRQIFTMWLHNSVTKPNYKVLLDALVAAEDQRAIYELCQTFSKQCNT